MGQVYVKFIAVGPTPLEALDNLKRIVQVYYPEYELQMYIKSPVCFISKTNSRPFVVIRDESVVSEDYGYFVHLPRKCRRLAAYWRASGETPERAISNLWKLVHAYYPTLNYDPDRRCFTNDVRTYNISNPTHVCWPVSEYTDWTVHVNIPFSQLKIAMESM